MSRNLVPILKSRRFLPLFMTQFLGAANDNLYKSALIMLITFRLASEAGLDGRVLVTVAAGVFIAPFFIFSATAGQLADRFDKAVLARLVKGAEILIMAGAGAAFASGNIVALITVLFLMGSQSTFFGPIKYSILPQHLNPDDLIAANALISGATFLAILGGTIAGGLLILQDGGIAVVSFLVMGLAVLGFGASLMIPKAPPANFDVRVNPNIVGETVQILRHALGREGVFISILGISWFWLVGATFLSQFPAFAKTTLGGDENIVTLLLATFSVGIGGGALVCAKILNGRMTTTYIPYAGVGMTVFMVDLYFASTAMTGVADGAIGAFLTDPLRLRILLDLLMISIFGGVFIVPLYVMLQSQGDVAHRARDIAANNIMNALFMVVSALGVVMMLAGGMTIPHIFLVVAVANVGVAVFLRRVLHKKHIATM